MTIRRNILITGASSGLGKGMAIEFAKQGCNLALCARRFENLESLRNELLEINANIQVFIRSLDVNDHDAVFDVFNDFKEDMGQVDRVIVNAGMGKGASIGTGYFHANKQTAITNFVSALAQCEAGSKYQFLRIGYFCADAKDHNSNTPVFNRTVGLRDTWAKINKNKK